jgi:hypothetical protein
VQVAYRINGTADGSWPATPSAPDWEGGMVPGFEGYGCGIAAACYKPAIDRFYSEPNPGRYSASYRTLITSNSSRWSDEIIRINAFITSDNFGAFGATYSISMAVSFGHVGVAIEQQCRYITLTNTSLNENTLTTTVILFSRVLGNATVSATFLGTSLSLSDGESSKTYTTSDRTGAVFPITFTANRIATVYRSLSGANVAIYQNISIELLGFLDAGLNSLYSPPAGDYQNNLPLP